MKGRLICWLSTEILDTQLVLPERSWRRAHSTCAPPSSGLQRYEAAQQRWCSGFQTPEATQRWIWPVSYKTHTHTHTWTVHTAAMYIRNSESGSEHCSVTETVNSCWLFGSMDPNPNLKSFLGHGVALTFGQNQVQFQWWAHKWPVNHDKTNPGNQQIPGAMNARKISSALNLYGRNLQYQGNNNWPGASCLECIWI